MLDEWGMGINFHSFIPGRMNGDEWIDPGYYQGSRFGRKKGIFSGTAEKTCPKPIFSRFFPLFAVQNSGIFSRFFPLLDSQIGFFSTYFPGQPEIYC